MSASVSKSILLLGVSIITCANGVGTPFSFKIVTKQPPSKSFYQQPDVSPKIT
jgi:hypothetical protein